MRELVKFADLRQTSTAPSLPRDRSSQQRDTVHGFARLRVPPLRTDKVTTNGSWANAARSPALILEGAWQDYAPTLQRNPRPSLRAIQFLIENQFQGKKPLPKPEQFVDTSLSDQLEKSGFVDSVYK
jgi:hypothetical protein